MRVLSLFAGIGGFDLGFALAGFEIVAQVEIDEYCRRVLKYHFPSARQYGDIKGVTGEEILADCGPIDVICGGFPCQDISQAGKGAGLDGERSALWWEMHRLIREIKPLWVVAENVSALRTRGLDRVVLSLEKMGGEVQVLGISARNCGAPHERKRLIIVSHMPSQRRSQRQPAPSALRHTFAAGSCTELADTYGELRTPSTLEEGGAVVAAESISQELGSDSQLADTDCDRLFIEPGRGQSGESGQNSPIIDGLICDPTSSRPQDWWQGLFKFPVGPGARQHEWEHSRTIESAVGVTANGIPRKLALRAIGNGFVPAIPYAIARTIQRFERLS